MKEEKYGNKFKDHLIEQYKMFVEMADRYTSRRGQTSRFYIVLLTGLLAILSVYVNMDLKIECLSVLLFSVSISGLAICWLWRRNIDSYRQLAKAKYDTIRDMEKNLPYSCYSKEWKILQENNYKKLTEVEKQIPIVFSIPYLILLIYSVYDLLTIVIPK